MLFRQLTRENNSNLNKLNVQ